MSELLNFMSVYGDLKVTNIKNQGVRILYYTKLDVKEIGAVIIKKPIVISNHKIFIHKEPIKDSEFIRRGLRIKHIDFNFANIWINGSIVFSINNLESNSKIDLKHFEIDCPEFYQESAPQHLIEQKAAGIIPYRY